MQNRKEREAPTPQNGQTHSNNLLAFEITTKKRVRLRTTNNEYF